MTRIAFIFSSAVVAALLSLPSIEAQQQPAEGRGQGQGRAGGAAGQQGRGGGGGGGQGDPWAGKKKLLAVADVQSGFHHDSISHALASVEQIGREKGDWVTMIRTDSQLITKGQIVGKDRYEGRGVNARTLDFYDAMFMLPSGFGTMNEQQKKELLAFVHDDGKGLVVGHATGVAFTNWPEFAEMVGGYMDGEFNATSTVIVEDPKFPGASAFGTAPFQFMEQHPRLKEPYSRSKVHVIMRLDPDKLEAGQKGNRTDGDYPVVWAVQYGKGRVYNVGWGHHDATWDDPRFRNMMREAIKWALGVVPGDATPRPFPK